MFTVYNPAPDYESRINYTGESGGDDCASCECLEECRHGKRRGCIMDEITEIIPAYIREYRRK